MLIAKKPQAYRERSFLNPGRFVQKIDGRANEPRVFLFRPLLNGLGGYTNLIARIRGSTNLYGLQFPDALSIYEPDVFASVGKLYAGAITSVPLDSSLYLVGWSLGGLFALECARHLRSMGRSVEAVILVEAAPFPEDEIPVDPQRRSDFFWKTFFENKLFKEDQERLAAECDFLSLSERKRLTLIRRNELSFPGPFVERIDIRKELRFVTDMLIAQSQYKPRAYDGRCYLITGDENRISMEQSWARMPVSDLEMVHTRGGHVELMLHFAVEPIYRVVHGLSPLVQSASNHHGLSPGLRAPAP
jgi:thioesterase domain-containing protein